MLIESSISFMRFFFFQAEDGIRDGHVTGVQTCALPISALRCSATGRRTAPQCSITGRRSPSDRSGSRKIGRASCREREERGEVDVGVDEEGVIRGGGTTRRKRSADGKGDRVD